MLWLWDPHGNDQNDNDQNVNDQYGNDKEIWKGKYNIHDEIWEKSNLKNLIKIDFEKY